MEHERTVSNVDRHELLQCVKERHTLPVEVLVPPDLLHRLFCNHLVRDGHDLAALLLAALEHALAGIERENKWLERLERIVEARYLPVALTGLEWERETGD